MTETNGARFFDRRTDTVRPNNRWPVTLIKKADLDEQFGKLQDGDPGADGRREVLVAHPESEGPGLGLAPAVEVSFGVLLPGEATVPRRQNASSFAMCIGGRAEAKVDETTYALERWDSWNTPAMNVHLLRNTGDEPFRYVTYSNAAFLRKLEAFFEELNPPEIADGEIAENDGASQKAQRAKEIAGPGFAVGDTGAMVLPYEHLIDPDPIESEPLLWAWRDVAPHLGLVEGLGTGYTGRPLLVLYNPATGNRNGTTPSFFATILSSAPSWEGPNHRHISSAINYIMEGDGYSVVEGERVEWAAGDIMLSAPGWAQHAHNMGPEGAVILTVQDHPLHIASESLVWQEEVPDGPILGLGTQVGFETNLGQFAKG